LPLAMNERCLVVKELRFLVKEWRFAMKKWRQIIQDCICNKCMALDKTKKELVYKGMMLIRKIVRL
jgi:hypothetical protein